MTHQHPMKIAIDGASGFIGVHSAAELVRRGHSVVAMVRAETDPRDVDVLHQIGATTAVWCANEPDSLVDAMTGCQCLVHLIGSIAPRKGESFAIIHQGLAAQFCAAAKAAGVDRIVMISTVGAAQDAASMYHRTKWQSEQRLQQSGMDWVVLRSPLVVGRSVGHRDSKIVRRYLNLIAKKRRVPLVLGGKNTIQPIAVNDLAHATGEVIEQPKWNGRILEVAGAETMTTRQFVERLMNAVGVRRDVKAIPGPVAWLVAVMLERFQAVPLLSRDQLRIAKTDAVCTKNALVNEFGIEPTALDDALAVYQDCIP